MNPTSGETYRTIKWRLDEAARVENLTKAQADQLLLAVKEFFADTGGTMTRHKLRSHSESGAQHERRTR